MRAPQTLFFAPPSATSAAVVDIQDVGEFTQYLVDVTSAGTSTTHVIEGTLDGASWRALPFIDLSSVIGVPLASKTSAGLIGVDVSGFKQVRLRVSAYGSGTFTAKTAMTVSPYPLELAITGLGAMPTANAIPTASATQGVGSVTAIRSVAGNNYQQLKSSAGRIIGGKLRNRTATESFLKIFDTGSAVTMGTTSAGYTLVIPANGELDLSSLTFPIPLSAAIKIAITNGVAANDNTSTTADQIVGYIQWI